MGHITQLQSTNQHLSLATRLVKFRLDQISSARQCSMKVTICFANWPLIIGLWCTPRSRVSLQRRSCTTGMMMPVANRKRTYGHQMMLVSDMVLRWDKSFRDLMEPYNTDDDSGVGVLREAFGKAFKKLTELGCPWTRETVV